MVYALSAVGMTASLAVTAGGAIHVMSHGGLTRNVGVFSVTSLLSVLLMFGSVALIAWGR